MRALGAALLLFGCAESYQTSTIRDLTTQSTLRELSPPALASRETRTREPKRRSAPAELGACGRLSWPVLAPLSSPFGPRDGRPHDGIDLAVGEGTPVRAACDGVVAYADDKLRGYGKLVILAHAGGLATVYAHNSRLEVKEGEHVARGQEIARSGATGHVTAPHVHFEVRRDDRPVDPLNYLAPVVQARNEHRPARRETQTANP